MGQRNGFEEVPLRCCQGIDQFDVERTRRFVIDDIVFQPNIDMPMVSGLLTPPLHEPGEW